MDEGQRHRQPAVDVGLLRRDPAEIVKARQAAVLDDEVQVLERCRDVVDIANIECVLIQGDPASLHGNLWTGQGHPARH